MNTIIIPPPTLPVLPFEGYGGTQRGIYDLLKYFPTYGHKVHMIAPGDSDVSDLENVVLHAGIEFATRGSNNHENEKRRLEQEQEYKNTIINLVSKIIGDEQISIINSRIPHPVFLQQLAAQSPSIPIVTSLHTFNNKPQRIEALKNLNREFSYTTHCINHRAQYGNLENINVIMYGIDVSTYPYSPATLTQLETEPNLEMLRQIKERGKDYFIMVSRISPKKGQKTAIQLVLEETDYDIIIAGTPIERGNSKGGTKYFEEHIRPYLTNDGVHYYGNAREEEKKELLKYALGFLFPSGFEDNSWKEPFGRVAVEALACGVPVLAYSHGSLPEIIRPGENGLLFQTMDEARALIKELRGIDRYQCRQSAETHFDAKRVAHDYHELFMKIIGDRP